LFAPPDIRHGIFLARNRFIGDDPQRFKRIAGS
jgi:hypothetical protein